MGEAAESGSGHSNSTEDILQSLAPYPYQSLNAEREILTVNDAWLDLLAYDRDDVIGRWFGDLLTADSRTTFEDQFEDFKSNGEISNVELELRGGNDTTIIGSFDGVIEYDDQGDVVRTHCQFTDITEQKHRKASFENSSDVIMMLDEDGRAKYVSPSVERIMGYDPAELRGRMAFEDIHPDDRERAMEVFTEAIENPGTVATGEYRIRDAEGAWKWVEGRGKSLLDEPGIEAVVINARVIDERKEYEQKLKTSEAKYRSLFEDARDAIILLDDEGFFDCNEMTLELFGLESVEAFTEQTPWKLSPSTQPDGTDSKEAAQKHIRAAFEEGEAFFEWVHTRSDGTEFPAEVKLSRFQWDGEPVLRALVRDITERKEYEAELKEQRDNLEILNQVVRHDIRNDMTVVRGRAVLLEESIEREDDAWDDLQAIQESTEQAIVLTKTARDLAETMLSTEADVEAVNLDRHLDSVIENARSEFDDAIITVEDRIPDVTIQGNELLETVFRNLVRNAVVHNDKDAPEVHISTTVDNDTLTVAVADNGPGIPDDQKETIFGKGEKGLDSPGTGIGLYLVDTLVEQYGGEVWVKDNEPEGSVFYVELPIIDSSSGDTNE